MTSPISSVGFLPLHTTSTHIHVKQQNTTQPRTSHPHYSTPYIREKSALTKYGSTLAEQSTSFKTILSTSTRLTYLLLYHPNSTISSRPQNPPSTHPTPTLTRPQNTSHRTYPSPCIHDTTPNTPHHLHISPKHMSLRTFARETRDGIHNLIESDYMPT
jgi:hypothetical protein